MKLAPEPVVPQETDETTLIVAIVVPIVVVLIIIIIVVVCCVLKKKKEIYVLEMSIPWIENREVKLGDKVEKYENII